MSTEKQEVIQMVVKKLGVTEAVAKEIIKLLSEQLDVSKEVVREYLMERSYHGVSHEEALRRAQESPWAK